jgi:Uma2 family endonuclease
MSAAKILLSAEEFDNYPFEEDKRYELDEGELIETERPAYRHNRVTLDLLVELERYFQKHPIGEVLCSENVYALSPSTRRSPDVAVILGDRYEELKDATVITIIPEICVEVLSPNETTRQTHRKLKQYFDAGVKEVWLVDPESREVEIWTGPALPNRALVAGESLASALLPGFGMALDELFG